MSSSTAPRRRTKLVTEKKIAEDEFMAAAIGDVEWLRQSLRATRGAVNFDKHGLSPMHLASIHGRLDCLKMMVEKFKMDVNLPSSTGWRPVHLCISNQTGKRSFQCLCYLLQHGADPSCCNDDGITPCHQAASEGHVHCLKLLLDMGASVTECDRRGHTPLDLAKLWGHRKCARLLAAEEWHQSKDFLAGEMHQLKRVKMQQVLKEIEDDMAVKAQKQVSDDKAFLLWLSKHNMLEQQAPPKASLGRARSGRSLRTPQETTTTTATAAASTTKPEPRTQEPDTLDYRRVQLATKNDVIRSVATSARTTKTNLSSRESQKIHERPEIPAPQNEEPNTSREDKNKIQDWNKSTKVVSKEYLPNLTDYYPRDPYSMQPKYKLFKSGSRDPTMILDEVKDGEKAGVKVTTKTPLRMPQLPSNVLNEELGKKPRRDRPVVYKSKNIIDAQHKRLYEDEQKPAHSEIGMHITSDVTSPFFQTALHALQLAGEPCAGSSAGRRSATCSQKSAPSTVTAC